MCKVTQYVHSQCRHVATAPFVSKRCENACRVVGRHALEMKVATRRFRKVVAKHEYANYIYLTSRCRKCEAKNKDPKGKIGKFDPYSARHCPFLPWEEQLVTGRQWHIPQVSSTKGVFREVNWDQTSIKRPSQLINSSDEEVPQSPKTASVFDMERIRNEWSSWSFDENASVCPKPLVLMAPKPLKLIKASQTPQDSILEQNHQTEQIRRQNHQIQTLRLLEGSIQPIQSELEADIMSQLHAEWPPTDNTSPTEYASTCSRRISGFLSNTARTSIPITRSTRESQSTDYNPWIHTIMIQPAITSNRLSLTQTLRRRTQSQPTVVNNNVWAETILLIRARPQSIHTSPNLATLPSDLDTKFEAATALPALVSPTKTLSPIINLASQRGKPGSGICDFALTWLITLTFFLFVWNTMVW